MRLPSEIIMAFIFSVHIKAASPYFSDDNFAPSKLCLLYNASLHRGLRHINYFHLYPNIHTVLYIHYIATAATPREFVFSNNALVCGEHRPYNNIYDIYAAVII